MVTRDNEVAVHNQVTVQPPHYRLYSICVGSPMITFTLSLLMTSPVCKRPSGWVRPSPATNGGEEDTSQPAQKATHYVKLQCNETPSFPFTGNPVCFMQWLHNFGKANFRNRMIVIVFENCLKKKKTC